MKKSKSELGWHLPDYLREGIEPPARCISNPELTEGQMMSALEVEQFIVDSIATLRILGDHNSPKLEEVTGIYKEDLAYLLSVGSLTDTDYNELVHPDNLRF